MLPLTGPNPYAMIAPLRNRGRSVAVNMSACQAEDRGFESRRSRWGYTKKEAMKH